MKNKLINPNGFIFKSCEKCGGMHKTKKCIKIPVILKKNKILYCNDFINNETVSKNFYCCSSCHEDNELGYENLMSVELFDGRKAYVCCRMRQELEDLNLCEKL